MDTSTDAAEAAGAALEQALLKATRAVESELERIVRNGEADIERLARAIAETLARLAVDSALGRQAPAPFPSGADTGAPGSLNQIASAIAKAAMRGARFT